MESSYEDIKRNNVGVPMHFIIQWILLYRLEKVMREVACADPAQKPYLINSRNKHI